jgi:hypothetical protein
MICWFNNDSNDVLHNTMNVFLTSSFASKAHGLYVHKENFRNSVSLFLSRSNTSSNWIIQPNVYLKPSKGINQK